MNQFRKYAVLIIILLLAFSSTSCDLFNQNEPELSGENGSVVKTLSAIAAIYSMYTDYEQGKPGFTLSGISTQLQSLQTSVDNHFSEVDKRLRKIETDLVDVVTSFYSGATGIEVGKIESNIESSIIDATHLDEDVDTYAGNILTQIHGSDIISLRKFIFFGLPEVPSKLERMAKAVVFDARNGSSRPAGEEIPYSGRPDYPDDWGDYIWNSYINMAADFAYYFMREKQAVSVVQQAYRAQGKDEVADNFKEDYLYAEDSPYSLQKQCDEFIRWVEYLVLNTIDWASPEVSSGTLPDWALRIFNHADLLVAQTMGHEQLGVFGRKIYLNNQSKPENVITVMESEGISSAFTSGVFERPAGATTAVPAGLGNEISHIHPHGRALYSEAVHTIELESPEIGDIQDKKAVYIEHACAETTIPSVTIEKGSSFSVVHVWAPLPEASQTSVAIVVDQIRYHSPDTDLTSTPVYIEEPDYVLLESCPVEWYLPDSMDPVTSADPDALPYVSFAQVDRRGLGWALTYDLESLPWSIHWRQWNAVGDREGDESGEVSKFMKVSCKLSGHLHTGEANHLLFTVNDEDAITLQVDSENNADLCDPGEHLQRAWYLHARAASPVIYVPTAADDMVSVKTDWEMEMHAIYGQDNGAEAYLGVYAPYPSAIDWWWGGYAKDECRSGTKIHYWDDTNDLDPAYWHTHSDHTGWWSAQFTPGSKQLQMIVAASQQTYHQREYNEARVDLKEFWIEFD